MVEGQGRNHQFQSIGKTNSRARLAFSLCQKKKIMKRRERRKNEEQLIPEFTVGSGEHEPFVHQGRTSPPKPYTEAVC